MAKKKAQKVEPVQVEELSEDFKFKHGDVADIPVELLVANDWNPNEMTPDEFDMLSENVDDVGFLTYPVVVPLTAAGVFRIIDGYHRVEQQRLSGVETIRCILADPERMDEVEQMRQTVRLNKIKGQMSPRKFQEFVDRFMSASDTPEEDLPHVLGFTDIDEFQEMLDQARETLPNEEMKEEFDKAKNEIKSIDDLSSVLNRLFNQYGSTLPYNFMVLDFGGKNHLWVRMDKKTYETAREKAMQIKEAGYTFDSVITRILRMLDVDAFIERHSAHLEEADLEEAETQDDVLAELDDE